MVPVLPILIIAGLGALYAGCSSPEEPGSNPQLNDDLDAGADADVDLDASIDAHPDADLDAGDDSGPPPTPPPPSASYYSDAPCAFPASITHDPNDNTLLLTCGGAQNGLFRSPPLGTSGTWELAGPANGFPSNHIELGDQHYAVAHSMPDGITIINAQNGTISDSVDLGSLEPLDQAYQPVGFALNTPAGMALIGGKLYIATSNIDQVDYQDPSNTTFHAGTVLYMNYNNGELDESSARVLFTSRENPTAVKQTDSNEFAVLSSGNYMQSPDNAALDICDAQSHLCITTELGDVTAQASPVMPITDCELLLISTQKPVPGLKAVDKVTGSIVIDFNMPAKGFISHVSAYKDVAIMSDFGIFGQGGAVLYKHSYPPIGWMGIPITEMPQGSTGPSVVVGDKLYLTLTDNDGLNGSIWKLDLSNMD